MRKVKEVTAVEANIWLDEAGLLKNRPDRLGGPLRSILREGKIKNSEQRPNHPYGRWFIKRF